MSTNDVLSIVKQNADLYKSLDISFDFSPGAVGKRIGNIGEAHLGGARVAPYEFYARPKGSTGDWIFTIIIEAETKYFKKSGEVATIFDGEVIKETLIGVRIVPVNNARQAEQDRCHAQGQKYSLATLYAAGNMPADLLKAHNALDKAVDAAYNYKGSKDDAARVAFLFECYQKLTNKL
jgi:hypothetical protein